MVYVDETGAPTGNADGRNPTGKRGWLWVAMSPVVTVFLQGLSRSAAAATELLGHGFGGIVVSDRFSAYNHLPTPRNARRLRCARSAPATPGLRPRGFTPLLRTPALTAAIQTGIFVVVMHHEILYKQPHRLPRLPLPPLPRRLRHRRFRPIQLPPPLPLQWSAAPINSIKRALLAARLSRGKHFPSVDWSPAGCWQEPLQWWPFW